MNLFTQFSNLQVLPKQYYGTVLSKEGDQVTVTVLGGGSFTVSLNTALNVQDRCWLTFERGNWTVESAPTLTDGGVIEI